MTADCTFFVVVPCQQPAQATGPGPAPGPAASTDPWVPAGLPISGTQVVVVGTHGRWLSRVLPVGQEGEVWVGGAAVSPGYHRNPAATAARFVELEMELAPEDVTQRGGGSTRVSRSSVLCSRDLLRRSRYFRTGDLGVVLPSGQAARHPLAYLA